MPTPNADRALVRIIRGAAGERGIAMTLLADGWIVRLTKGAVVRFIHGYAFDVNPAGAQAVANDKAGTYEALAAAGVSAIEHRLFLHPDLAKFAPHMGNWAGMLRTFHEYGRDVVVKDNTGTGGADVHRVRSELELEAAATGLFQRGKSVSMSPFVEIEREVRVVVLDGEPRVVYEKRRFSVVGDGRRTVAQLLSESDPTRLLSCPAAIESAFQDDPTLLSRRPASNERVFLNWKHNLGQGAVPVLLDASCPDFRSAIHLGVRSAAALGLRLCSVDLVRLRAGLQVLEVNAGVMMEALAGTERGEQYVRSVYFAALDAMFVER